MAVLNKTKIHGNERWDLSDYENIESFVCADFNEMYRRIFTDTSLIVSGFDIFQDVDTLNPTPTTGPVYIKIEDSVLLHTSKTTGAVMFVGNSSDAPTQIDLTSSSTNFIEIDLTTQDDQPGIRAFWDPTANAGEGGEFAQTVNTATNLIASVTVNTSGFSLGDKIPLVEVEVDSGGTITAIYDRRNLLFRLGRAVPYDDDFEFPWSGGRNEAEHTITLSGVAGSFSVDEIVTGGSSGTTAIIVTGGTGPIVIKAKSAASFTIGETLTGGDSGATATLVTIKEDLLSADKSIVDLKGFFDAITTEIKQIKFGAASGRYWFETADTSLISTSHLHTQGSPSTTWTVVHSLGEKYVNVMCYDSTDKVIFPDSITAVDTTTTTIVFATSRTGKARITV